MSITVRLRHPRGVTTLQIEPETTYEELQIMIFSATEIPLDTQELKYGYPPKPLPSSVLTNPSAQLSLIPITKGEQIIVTERKTPIGHTQSGHRTTSSQDAARNIRDIMKDSNQVGSNTIPAPLPALQPANFFETAATPKSTTSTATHTPTPAPSVPRTVIPSPYMYNYPGTGPASAASSTSGPANPNIGSSLAVPASARGHIGSSPLTEKNQSGQLNGRPSRGLGADAGQHLGADNALTSLSESGQQTNVNVNDGMGSVLVHRVVPDDNSCLFSAIGLVFMGKYDEIITKELREGKWVPVYETLLTGLTIAFRFLTVVANEIRKDPVNFSDVMLGRSREDYIDTIQKPNSWGGAIELAIFAKHYKTEIDSYDVLTGRADRFGEGEYENRCILIYSGIHYDAATSAPMLDAPSDFHTSIFPISDGNITKAADQLVAKLKEKHYYTDTQNFDLRCQVCQIGLKGEQGAREHAIKTGHVEFGEY